LEEATVRVDSYGLNNPALEKFTVHGDTVIWRYLTIDKYLDLLTQRALWFTRAVILRKEDPYEASHTPSDLMRLRKIAAARSKDELRDIVTKHGLRFSAILNSNESLETMQAFYLGRLQNYDAYLQAVSCWHANHGESDAMWKLYSEREAGIAIRTTVKRLKDAFSASSSDGILTIGKVVYDEFDDMTIMTNWNYASLLVKRQAFSHEREVRVMVDCYEGFENLSGPNTYLIDPTKSVPPRTTCCL
jgi:hypothetical protein